MALMRATWPLMVACVSATALARLRHEMTASPMRCEFQLSTCDQRMTSHRHTDLDTQ